MILKRLQSSRRHSESKDYIRMEKVFINPVAKEIVLKASSAKEGPVDVFTYDGNGAAKTLGSLYLVGNIQGGAAEGGDDLDVGYVLNLVASLAKREYYSDPSLDPKEAFSNALKKINGVVEEFFKRKDTKINIGIFTIAGEQIHISKLGKFKIILAREGKNIDILNNLQLFNKEIIEEKEFSNIISGKISEGDKLLAFYPNRAVVAREKSLKESLLNSDQEKFATQLASIKESKPDFSCVALHLDLQQGKEAANEERVQPKELKEEAPVQLAVEDSKEPENEEEPEKKPETEIVPEPMPEPKPVAQTVAQRPVEPPMPKIIPSEFARGKRELLLAKHLRRVKNMNVSPRSKPVIFGGAAVAVLAIIFGLKSFVFVSASAKEMNAAVSQAQNNLKLAQTKISQNDLSGAWKLLTSSISTITGVENKDGQSKKADDTKAELTKALDNLDQAVAANLSVVAEIPADSGAAKLVTSSGSDFYAYLTEKDGSGALVKISGGQPGQSNQIKDTSPQGIFSGTNDVALIDPTASKIATLNTSKSNLSSSTYSTDPLTSYEIYQDNLYGLTGSGIVKITDAALGKTQVTQWLTDPLPANPKLLTVDGNIYVLTSDGLLDTYYKGQKKNEVNVVVSPEVDSLLLTNTNSPNLYLINPSSGRIYAITKTSGTIAKAYKLGTQNIDSATLGSDDTIYILSDNKIWKVQ